MAEDVTIHVSAFGTGTLLSGVYVALHDSDTKVQLQVGATDVDGKVIFPNVDPAVNSGVYEIRVVPTYPGSVVDGNVQNITIIDGPVNPQTNEFDVLVTPQDLPVATNPNLCRCTGYFVDATGRPRKSLSLHLSEAPTFYQLEHVSDAVDSKAIVPSKIIVTSDSTGKMVVDLYRSSEYGAYIEGYQNITRMIKIPDAAAANLSDILFPLVSQIKMVDGQGDEILNPNYAVTVGETTEAEYKVILRSGAEADSAEVTFESSDVAIATVSISDNKLLILGVAAGNATIEVSRVSTEGMSSMIDEPNIVSPTIIATVT